ncbi:ABC transporter permease [Herbidospora daliensis]|uniref:ABC transporter permease n=1 Tax=Herbidospora daliensis TaxID=295585 RepID=UPI00078406EB|nr:ABC transporter permease [Herbidospora daliensis]
MTATLTIGLARASLETKLFFRQRDAVIFTFSFPIILLVLFGSIFEGDLEGTGITVAQLYSAGLIGAGVMGVAFQNLAIGIAIDRDDGTLKRLAGTPMPRAAYFVGKLVSSLVLSAIEVALLLLVAVLLFDLELPTDFSRWATLVWVLTLGLAGAALLGIAVSSLPRNAKSAAAVVSMPYVLLQFISGVYIPFTELPSWLNNVAAVFPLKWMCQGLRSVFLGDAGAALELTGSYELPKVAMVLGLWLAGGLVLCLATFRWTNRGES